MLAIRPFSDTDTPAVLALLEASMGWVPDGLNSRFFSWKHRENPFGPSPAWVAIDETAGGRIAGFRTFLRWEFERAGQTVRAVRAVDTATHPDYQGQGVFSRLTLAAVDELRAAKIAFVFNTPNARSLPGYLKMGWRHVGRLPVDLRVRSFSSLPRVASGRTSAEKWSLATSAGIAANEAFAARDATSALLTTIAARPGLATLRTPGFLSWRYGFEPLAYRVVRAGPELEEGAVVFRLRRRGSAIEAAIVEVLVPAGDRGLAAALCRRVLRESGADYALRLRTTRQRGFVPLPRQGPTLVYRALTSDREMPGLRDWRLSLGDVELL